MLKVNAKTGELFIYDVIGKDWYGEGITGESVSEALDQLDGARAIVRVNSPGGVADEGIAIYNALKRYPGGVDTHNDALAASAASIVFLAGENRYAGQGSRFMIHRALTIDIGNASQLRKTADTLETYDSSLVEIYSEYMSESPEEILALMEAESWYGVDAAVEHGFATAKTGKKANAEAKIASWFKHPPQDLAVAASMSAARQRDIRTRMARSF
jgi:ATP-dependent Clp protease protease subunit